MKQAQRDKDIIAPAPQPFRRRAGDVPPPGQRAGQGADSVLPYLAHSVRIKPTAGPPGGIERRSVPRNTSGASALLRSEFLSNQLPQTQHVQSTSDAAFESWKQADARARAHEAQLAHAWKDFDAGSGPAPDPQLVAEVALFREVAHKRLSELLRVMKAETSSVPGVVGTLDNCTHAL